MRVGFLVAFVLFLVAVGQMMAQGRGERSEVYPSELYPGENVVTVRNADGIDKIRFRASSQTTVVVPPISGCPTSVDVVINVGDATTSEQVDLTVHDCDGTFATVLLRAQNWQIRKEYTGKVRVGGDTCLQCEIVTSDRRLVDSIVVSNPNVHVIMPPGSAPWQASGSDFHYQVCYHAAQPENIREMIRIYIRRDQPNAGLAQYVIEKPLTAAAVVPPPPPKPDTMPRDTVPPLVDPTTFRNILMPTAESLGGGGFFAGNYDLAGWLAGYGPTDRLTLLLGTAAVPDFISKLFVATAGVKYEVLRTGLFNAAVGGQFAYTSTKESDISVEAPYSVFSYGNRRNRISLALGYSWKRHSTTAETFKRQAYIVGIGGDVTLARGLKLAAETYVIESSGLNPFAITLRWFGRNWALDAGLGLDLANFGSVQGTGALSGEITNPHLAPVLSFIWRW
ncbi:MAG: hypothetical protein JST22_18235 [Bacteroidetes bacterium]|nr:hypothetical protein [Bacteroidota bacterium]